MLHFKVESATYKNPGVFRQTDVELRLKKKEKQEHITIFC
ncbi:hypothetical protein NSMM_160004 [Nitrosomonas mobilis]|uniref:Uncharacterized protein n=1 Tax=Nitrosomonas mobilis TaxID=51642 RepID=A0A1G5SB40_9PROT|nr:hypothetical protein NSMM_160004 [Nitrosomonas mobilis]